MYNLFPRTVPESLKISFNLTMFTKGKNLGFFKVKLNRDHLNNYF